VGACRFWMNMEASGRSFGAMYSRRLEEADAFVFKDIDPRGSRWVDIFKGMYQDSRSKSGCMYGRYIKNTHVTLAKIDIESESHKREIEIRVRVTLARLSRCLRRVT